MPGRVRPVGVTAPGSQGAGSARPPAPAARPSPSSTRAATRDFSRSTTTLGASAESSSENRLATQPVATTRGPCGRPAARRTAFLVLASASPVTAQVFTTTAEASSSPTSATPARSSSDAMRSSSTRLTRQPRFTRATPGRPPRGEGVTCGP